MGCVSLSVFLEVSEVLLANILHFIVSAVLLLYYFTLLQLPLTEVGNAVRAYCYSIASYPWTFL